MSITKIARGVGSVAIARSTWGGSQNFLGAGWVEHLVDSSPLQIRKPIALRLLSLSPHYIYDRDIRAEAERNRQSRQALANALIAPYLSRTAQVIDYGCGPGYMANAVARMAGHVDAVDISRGVLACARALNPGPNITYQTPPELSRATRTVDLAYSFAVVQHLRTELVAEVLSLLASKIRQDGVLLIHFAVPGQGGWRTEAEYVENKSVANRAKLRYGLNCFGRSVDEMQALVASRGFTDVVVRPLQGWIKVPGDDDITRQHVLTGRRQ